MQNTAGNFQVPRLALVQLSYVSKLIDGHQKKRNLPKERSLSTNYLTGYMYFNTESLPNQLFLIKTYM